MKEYLSNLSAGAEGTIISILGGAGIKRRLQRLGLFEGQRVKKTSNIGGKGPVIVTVNRTQIAIGHGMAQKIVIDR
jgi:ferrous iron transport protein A